MKTVEQRSPVQSEKVVQVGASRLWWKRFVEQVSFEPGTGLERSNAYGTALLLETLLVRCL